MLRYFILMAACMFFVQIAANKFLNHAIHSSESQRRSKEQNTILTSIKGGYAKENVLHIYQVSDFDRALEEAGDHLVVVDFSAEWCGPCRMIAPYFEELATTVASTGTVFCKIDVDKTPELADRYEVQGMPTFLFIKNGKVVDRFAGASAQKLKETVDSLLP